MDESLELRFAREQRLARGNARRLERETVRRDLVRIRLGAYADSEEWAAADSVARHLALVAAARRAARREPVFSHESAAALLGIPIIGSWPSRVTATVRRGSGWSSGAVHRVHRDLDPVDVVQLDDGARVTSPARTAVDLAAVRSRLAGIIAMSEVRRRGVESESLRQTLDRAGRMLGIGAARAAFRDSVGGSDSPLETLVIVRCRDLGFAEPAQQHHVVGVDGKDYWVDFAWCGGEILGEADGRDKYRSADGGSDFEALWAEKRREDAIRARCRAFLRVSWEDAWGGVGLERRLLAAGVPRTRRPGALTL